MSSMQRKSSIISELKSKGSVDVAQLAQRFSVSEVTIRRDLAAMEKEQILHRVHGGAILNDSYSSLQLDFPYVIRGIQNYQSKEAICKLAATFIEDGDVLFIDNSSTLSFLPRFMPPHMSITVLTNSIGVLCESSKINNHNHTYVCLGGIYNSANMSTYGNMGLTNAGDFYPAKAFVSCASISPRGIITDASIHELDIKTLMLDQSGTRFLLADSSKFGILNKAYLCTLNKFHHLISDNNSLYDKIEKDALEGLQISIA